LKIWKSIKILVVSIFFFIGMSIADAKTFNLKYESVDFSNVDVPESVGFCIMQYRESSDYIFVVCYKYSTIYYEFGKGIVLAKSGGNPSYPIDFISYYYNKDSKTWSKGYYNDTLYGTVFDFCVYDDSYLYLRCKYFDIKPSSYAVLLALSTDIKYKDSNDVYMYKDSYNPVYEIPWVKDDYHNVSFDVIYLYRKGKRIQANLMILFDYIDNSLYNYDYGILGRDGIIYWEDLYPYIMEEGLTYKTITHNTTVFIRISDKTTGEMIKSYSYTITRINKTPCNNEDEEYKYKNTDSEDFIKKISSITTLINTKIDEFYYNLPYLLRGFIELVIHALFISLIINLLN